MRADERDDRLHDRHKERENKSKVTEFCNHDQKYNLARSARQSHSVGLPDHFVAGCATARCQSASAGLFSD